MCRMLFRFIFLALLLLLLLLLFSPSCVLAWPTWLRPPFRRKPEEGVGEGAAAAAAAAASSSSSTPRNSQPEMQSLPASFIRLKARANRDNHAARILSDVETKSRLSSCWKNALKTLKEGCISLRADDGARSQLALAMAMCDDEADGGHRAWPKCKARDDVRDCIHQLDNALYLVYVQYRLHTDVLCLYIQEEAFQERTEMAVQSLYAGAVEASETLQALWVSSGELHASVKTAAEQQAFNLAETRKLYEQLQDLRRGQVAAFDALLESTQHMLRSVADASSSLHQLHAVLDESTAKAAAAVNEVAREAAAFQSRTELHVNSMLHVLERVEMFQQALVEGTAGLGEIIRAASLLVVLVLLTIPARTAAARLPCIGIVTAAYALRPLLLAAPHRTLGYSTFFVSVTLAAGAILMFFACTYQSPEQTLRLLLRCELRRVFDDTRPLFLEDIRIAVAEGVIGFLPRTGDADSVQHSEACCSALRAPSHQNEGEETKRLTPQMVTKPPRRVPSRCRSRRC